MTVIGIAAIVLCIILVFGVMHMMWSNSGVVDADITGMSDSFPKYVKTNDPKQLEAAYDSWIKALDSAYMRLLTPDGRKLNRENRSIAKELIRRTRKWVPQGGKSAIKLQRAFLWTSLNLGTQPGNDLGVWILHKLNISVPPVLPTSATL